MAEITGFTADRMLEIENSTIVHGLINDEDNLILYTRDGRKINAGHIKGGTAQWIEDMLPVITEQGNNINALDERTREIGEDLYESTLRADEIEENLGELSEKTQNTVDLVGTIEQNLQTTTNKANEAIKNSVIEYALSDSRTVAPTSGWDTTQPAPTSAKPHVWFRTILTKGSGDTLTSSPAVLTGPEGQKGDVGDTGVSIVSFTPYYKAAKNYAPNIRDVTTSDIIMTNQLYNPNPKRSKTLEYFTNTNSTDLELTNDGVRYTKTIASTSILILKTGIDSSKFTTGETATILARIKASEDVTISARILSDSQDPQVVTTEWSWVRWTVEIGSDDRPNQVGLLVASSPIGTAIDISNIGIFNERFDGQWFGGDESLDSSFRSEYTGEAYESTSVLYGDLVAGQGINNARGYFSTWNGQDAMLVIPTTTATSSRPSFVIPEKLHANGGTVTGTANLEAPLSGDLHSRHLSMYIWSPSPPIVNAPNIAGTHPLMQKFNSLTSDFRVGWYNGANKGNGWVWWTDMGLYEGDLTVSPVNPEAEGWTDVAPGYKEGYDVFTSYLVLYDDGTEQWTEVTKNNAYSMASSAHYLSNLAYEFAENLVHTGQEPPAEPFKEGQVWFVQNENDKITSMLRWDGAGWQTHAMVTGIMIVPGEGEVDTIVDGTGFYGESAVLDNLRTTLFYADQGALGELVIKDIPAGNLDEDAQEGIDYGLSAKNRILLNQNEIIIQSSANNSMFLSRWTATSLDFVVDGSATAYINSETRTFAIEKAVIEDTLVVGRHQVKTLPGKNITTWQLV